MTPSQSTPRSIAVLTVIVWAGLAMGCGKSTTLVPLRADGAPSGSGGTTGSDAAFADANATGGTTSQGGVTATAGQPGTGGAIIPMDGGAPGRTGGASATGGHTGTGGVTMHRDGGGPGSGGGTGVGGFTATGGKIGTGGATATGGSTACGGPSGATCPEGSFCDVASECGKIADAAGVCVQANPRATCPATAKPVCGCENRTYVNDCLRQAVGMLKTADGACPSGPTSYPTAYVAWQLPASSAERGPAVIVDAAAGRMVVWDDTAGFSPEVPPPLPSSTKVLSLADTDSLWVRLAGVATNAIPHGTPGGTGCNASLYFRACRGCASFTVRYSTPQQVTPELDSIWSWFDSFMDPVAAAANPRGYCK